MSRDGSDIFHEPTSGHTWGLHPFGSRLGRLNKFLYTGAIKRVALNRSVHRPSKGSVSEFGFGIKAVVPAGTGGTKLDYVSDHLAIATGIKVVPGVGDDMSSSPIGHEDDFDIEREQFTI